MTSHHSENSSLSTPNTLKKITHRGDFPASARGFPPSLSFRYYTYIPCWIGFDVQRSVSAREWGERWSSCDSYDNNTNCGIIRMATSNGERYKARKPRGLVARAWSENCEEVEVPGSPKTPRTSTTPGIYIVFKWNSLVILYKKH